MSEIKYLPIKDMVDDGILQELNRRFLHPLGLALAVTQEDDGTYSGIKGMWDFRDDPEGMIFGSLDEQAIAKAKKFSEFSQKKLEERMKTVGYIIQPCPEVDEN